MGPKEKNYRSNQALYNTHYTPGSIGVRSRRIRITNSMEIRRNRRNRRRKRMGRIRNRRIRKIQRTGAGTPGELGVGELEYSGAGKSVGAGESEESGSENREHQESQGQEI